MSGTTLDDDDRSPVGPSTRDVPAPLTPSRPVRAPKSGGLSTRTGNIHAGLVVAAVLLVVLVVFLAQNSRAVTVHFLGAHLRISLAVALLAATLAGALIVGAAGTARIAQLRRQARHGTGRADPPTGP